MGKDMNLHEENTALNQQLHNQHLPLWWASYMFWHSSKLQMLFIADSAIVGSNTV